MPPLQVKDFPADVYERLRQCAREENRSISQQTLTIIEDYLTMRDQRVIPSTSMTAGMTPSSSNTGSNISNRERRQKILERISKRPLPEIELSSEELIRQIRDKEAR